MKRLWKTFNKGFKSAHDNSKWTLNKWRQCDGKIELCENGFHASTRIIDAMNYVACEALGLVEVRGESQSRKDKQAWAEMRLIKKFKWTKKDSVAMAIYSAELVIDNFEKEFPNDKRPREAIEAAKAWLKNPCKKTESAAMSAAESAWSAAESAAESAWSAAISAAESAWSAAESAAESAWSAAISAAESAWSADKMLNKIEKWILERIGYEASKHGDTQEDGGKE